jgi:hypothetical protein
MRHHRAIVLFAAVSLVAGVPALARQAEPEGARPEGTGQQQEPVQVDPEKDEILAAIKAAVNPTDEQMAKFVEHYTTLRREQRRTMREIARSARPDAEPRQPGQGRKGPQPADREARVAARKQAMEQLRALSDQFLADCRALLSPGQVDAWDRCVAGLNLMPEPPRGGRLPATKGPRVGDIAPGFELLDLEGNTVSLASLRGKPVVIEFGSYTCPVFRRKVDEIDQLRRDFGDAVHWVLVYTREAHPVDGLVAPRNTREGIEIPQHTSYEKRLACAKACAKSLGLNLRVLVDGFEDKVTQAWAGYPNRGYVIDAQGRVVSRQVWIDPARVRRALGRLLKKAPAADAPGGAENTE